MSDTQDTDIAIVGMAVRVPGAGDYRRFWSNVRGGVESVRRLRDDELRAAGEDPALLAEPAYVRSGAPLDGMELFDGEFFGFSPKESAILDPQHRHFLETTWEALEDGGYVPERFDGRIGVFAGCGMGSYFYFNLCSNAGLVKDVGMFLLRHTGNDKDFLSTRVSYLFNLTGPSVGVQTACSTSLVAVHMACQSLLGGECDLALAGGVTIELPHGRGYIARENEILSPDGHCRPFDHRARGTIFGSGAGVVLLRPLKAALAAGDHIHAVIRGSAINNDGAGKAGYLAPSVDGQTAVVLEALAVSGLDARTVEYVECHGTGTYLGDPIEVAALTRAYRQSTEDRGFCRIGSVKANIGHLDTAAGVAGLIKATLALEHGQLPPNINFEKPNPTLEIEKTPFVVSDRLVDWKRGRAPRRAAVHSLGVGGTNAHVILQEPPARPSAAAEVGAAGGAPELLRLSARSRAALDEACERLAAHLDAHPELRLADAAHTLEVGRRAFAQRRVLACRDRQEAIALLRGRDPARVFTHRALEGDPSVVFMFPGGGAVYPQMAKGLYGSDAAFRATLDRGLAWLGKKTGGDPRDVLFPAPGAEAEARKKLQRPSVQLPLLFLVEFALAQHLIDRGIKPRALVGHSLGENTAAAVAGVLSFEDALGLVHLRGTLFEEVPRSGMMSVPLPPDEVTPLLGARLDLACINGPGLCVVSGTDADLAALERTLAARDVKAQRVQIDIAAHSRLLEGILGRFGDYLRGVRLEPPKIPIVSNRTGTFLEDAQATSPEYWVQHLRGTVRFADDLATLAADPRAVFLEVGPGKTLGSLARQAPGIEGQRVISMMRHPEEVADDRTVLETACGRLWAVGFDLAPPPRPGARKVPLPTYAFQRQRYWIDAAKPQAAASAAAAVTAPRRASLDGWFWAPVWSRQDAAPDPDETGGPRTWLLFLDEAGLGTRLASRLRSRGEEVVTVSVGDTFHQDGERSFTLAPEGGAEGYSDLVRALVAAGKTPSRIVHLWLTAGARPRPGSNDFHAQQERGFYSLLELGQALAQAQANEELPEAPHLVVVTRGMQAVAGAAPAAPEQATVLGPCRVLPRELPGVSCKSVDLAPASAGGRSWREVEALLAAFVGDDRATGEALDAEAEALFVEALLPPTNETVALRGDTRWVLGQQRLALTEPAAPSTGLRERGVYLVTGGFGGLGTTFARQLARDCHARLVLVGRAPLPPREEWPRWLADRPADPASARIRTVQGLEALGAEVFVASGDVTDAARMTEIVALAKQRFGALHGVFHTAGVIDDGLIQTKRPAQIEAVFAAKVHGTRALDEAIRGEPLDFFVLFSSTSVTLGPAGQVDYVAANAYLDAFAAKARAEGRPVLSIAWGVWSDVGMAASMAKRRGLLGGATGAAAAPAHPLFAEKRATGNGGVILEATLGAAKDWVVNEHRTADGSAILPGTAYLELARAALRELEVEGAFDIEDLVFPRALHVPDDEPRAMRVRLQPDGGGYLFEVQTKHAAEGTGEGWAHHAQATLRPVTATRPEPLDIAAIDERCQAHRLPPDPAGMRTSQEDHLRFGPRWRVLREAAFGANEAFGRLAVPEAFRADLPAWGLHPGLVDIATGFALALAHGGGLAAQKLWVPISYRRVRVHAELPAQVVSWVRLSAEPPAPGFAAFDVSIADERGRVLVEVTALTMRRLEETTFSLSRPTAAELERDADGARAISAAERAFAENLQQGITAAEGARALVRVLANRARPPGRGQVAGLFIVSSLSLRDLLRQSEGLAAVAPEPQAQTAFERPALETEYVEPRDDVEKTLVGFWQELLGLGKVGVRDDFFELGGHSLVAVRLFAKIKKAFGLDLPISVLFEAPTIERCARLIVERRGPVVVEAGVVDTSTLLLPAKAAITVGTSEAPPVPVYRHLVMLHPGPSREAGRPLYVVAGMFGNVLNLHQLARWIGADRPVYALQARGLYGDQPPHETFEEAARDYIAELKEVQPEGPYLIGGFSGGGLAAYEMGRLLRAAGDEIALLVLLDTPLPKDEPLTLRDKLIIHRQNLERQGMLYPVKWLRDKQSYKKVMRQREAERQRQESDGGTMGFRSRVIEAAFYRALERYDLRPQPFDTILFRPRLRPMHELGPGRAINVDRRLIYPDNGWTPYVRKLEVNEVPGDHDSMVLEPNVRVLAARLRARLGEADGPVREAPGVRPAPAPAMTASAWKELKPNELGAS